MGPRLSVLRPHHELQGDEIAVDEPVLRVVNQLFGLTLLSKCIVWFPNPISNSRHRASFLICYHRIVAGGRDRRRRASPARPSFCCLYCAYLLIVYVDLILCCYYYHYYYRSCVLLCLCLCVLCLLICVFSPARPSCRRCPRRRGAPAGSSRSGPRAAKPGDV